MPRTLSDEEWNYLQVKRQTADLAESLYNDPQMGKEVKRLIKQKYPQISIPDYDIEQKVEARFQQENQRKAESDKAAKEKADKEQNEKWKAERESVQRQYGFTDDAMSDLEKFMLDNNVGSYEVAAGYKAAKNPQTSLPTHGSNWNHDKTDQFKEITSDPEGWARNQLLEAVVKDGAARAGNRSF